MQIDKLKQSNILQTIEKVRITIATLLTATLLVILGPACLHGQIHELGRLSDTPPSTEFGASVDQNDDYIVVGAPGSDIVEEDAGAIFIYDADTCELVHTLTIPAAPGGTVSIREGSRFGASVAISDQFIVVGADYAHNDIGVRTGQAYIYDIDTLELLHSFGSGFFVLDEGSRLGADVAISGNLAVVSTPDFRTDTNSWGLVYIVDLTTGSTVTTVRETSDFGSLRFAEAIDISGDRVICTDDFAFTGRSVRARVYDAFSGEFVFEINPLNVTIKDVAITEDTILIGAPENLDFNPNLAGAVFVYDAVTRQERFVLSGELGGLEKFGRSLDLDGDVALISSDLGQSYVYDVSTGEQLATLAPESIPTGSFGGVASINGSSLVVGSSAEVVYKFPSSAPTVTLDNGTLTIEGTPLDDEIEVYEIPIGVVTIIDGNLDLFLDVETLIVRGNDGNDTISMGLIDEGVVNNVVNGGLGDDEITVFGSVGANLFGGHGDDVLQGGLGPDFIRGGLGFDTINGRSGNDVIEGGTEYSNYDDSGNELQGGPGADTIHGGTLDDTIFGGDGGDLIFGDEGADTIFGSLGNDEIHGQEGDDEIFGGEAADTIFGGDGNDSIIGGIGQDTLYGNNGVDFVQGSEGIDFLNGGTGNDTLFGGSGDDQILGAAGNDQITGGLGSDELVGGLGNDIMSGNGGNDVLSGGPGNDTFTGGANRDTFDGGPGFDTATDTGENGETGIEN